MSRTEPPPGRGGLHDQPFSHQESKDGRVHIFWRGKSVLVLTGKKATSFLLRLEGLDAEGQQLVMARITGNFKRGNERRG